MHEKKVSKSAQRKTESRFQSGVRQPNVAAALPSKHSEAVCSFVRMCNKCVCVVGVCVCEKGKEGGRSAHAHQAGFLESSLNCASKHD